MAQRGFQASGPPPGFRPSGPPPGFKPSAPPPAAKPVLGPPKELMGPAVTKPPEPPRDTDPLGAMLRGAQTAIGAFLPLDTNLSPRIPPALDAFLPIAPADEQNNGEIMKSLRVPPAIDAFMPLAPSAMGKNFNELTREDVRVPPILSPAVTVGRGLGALAGINEAPTAEEWDKATEDSSALLTGAAAPKVIGGAARLVPKLPGVVADIPRPGPMETMLRKLSPGSHGPEFQATLETAMSELNAAGKPLTVEAGLEALDKRLTHNVETVNRVLGPQASTPVPGSGDAMAAARKAAIPTEIRLTNPGEFARLTDIADMTKGHNFTLKELNEMRQELNAKKAAYYRRNTTGQVVADETASALDIAAADTVRNLLHDYMENSGRGGGDAMREANRRIGAIMETRSALEKVANAAKVQELPLVGKALKGFATLASPKSALGRLATGEGVPINADFASAMRRWNKLPAPIDTTLRPPIQRLLPPANPFRHMPQYTVDPSVITVESPQRPVVPDLIGRYGGVKPGKTPLPGPPEVDPYTGVRKPPKVRLWDITD